MIRELNRDTKPNWYEKIQIELTLSDLQILYDCLGTVPMRYEEIKHKYTDFCRERKIYDSISTELYNGLDDILRIHNGITDDNKMVNLCVDVELKEN